MVKHRLHQIPRRSSFVTFAIALSVASVLGGPLGQSAEIGSIARGGRLYDNWILETRDRAPVDVQPNYTDARPTMHSTETSWRCVSCHGWDYLGHAAQGTSPLKQATALAATLSDDNHGYGEKLSKRNIADLAAFIADGRIEVAPYIAPGSTTALGDAARESALFATVCANCHGAAGQRIRSMLPLGTFARLRPREALHKILNGHPAERMPPQRFLPTARLGDMLAFIQTLPAKDLLGSIAKGGRLYDNWQRETDSLPPVMRHPAYPKDAALAASPETNWRCKECHGWDYKGRDGVYATGVHRTGINGIRALAGADPQVVIDLLMDANHLYHGTSWVKASLELQDLMDLANFVTLGQIDMDIFIDRQSRAAKGRTDRHKAAFDLLCVTCHGPTGKALATGRDIGDVARDNPWETLHKIRNGHPGEAMPALLVLDAKMFVDLLAEAQSLP